MASVRIEDSSGVERDTISLVSLEQEEKIGTQAVARIGVNRDELDTISNLTPGEDRVFVVESGVDTFGGILRSPGRGGGTPILIVDSFLRYMSRAQGTPLGQEKTGATDDTLISEAVDATPELSKGTISQVLSSGQTWVFSGISQAAKAYKVAEASGGEIEVTTSLAVNYGAEQHGSDKTATTLSPGNQSFAENTFTLDEDTVSGKVSHLSTYGVGQGTGQLEATVVPSADSASYPNKDTYTNNDWTSGDAEFWDRRTNKDIKRVSALQSWGQTLIADLQNTETRVKTVVKGETVNLGDKFTVQNNAEGLSATELRAVEVTKLIKPDSGTSYEVVFSNHSVGGRNWVEEKDKTQGRYEQAFEGDLTRISQAPGRGPVDSTHDYVIEVEYPGDVISEIGAELLIKGLNYRAFSQGAASGGDDTTASGGGDTTDDNAEFSAVTTSQSGTTATSVGTSKTELFSVSPSNKTSEFYAIVLIKAASTKDISVWLENTTDSRTVPSSFASAVEHVSGEWRSHWFVDPTNVNGETVTIQAQVGSGSVDVDADVLWIGAGPHTHDQPTHTHGQPAHTHLPDPGILDWDGSDQSPAHYPDSLSVTINGSPASNSISFSSGTDDGTGEFEGTLDMGGELSSGWNKIAVSSGGKGHLDCTFVADLVRQKL